MKKLFSSIIGITFVILFIVGEIKCIVKAIRCNWDPVGKAEIIYSGAAVTGLGFIIGWLDIQDKQSNMNKLFYALLTIVLVIANLYVGFNLLSLPSDWAVVIFILQTISLIYFTFKIIKQLL